MYTETVRMYDETVCGNTYCFFVCTDSRDTYKANHTYENNILLRNYCMLKNMLNKNTWGVKNYGANQKQHCKRAGAIKRFDIS